MAAAVHAIYGEHTSRFRDLGQATHRLIANPIKDLNNLIRSGVENAPQQASLAQQEAYYEKFKKQFFGECEHELTRVNHFFLEKLAEARRKHGTLKLQLLAASNAPGYTSSGYSLQSPQLSEAYVGRSSKLMTLRQLRNAYTEFYLTLVLLLNFQMLNETGFKKICKKYDKYLKSNHGNAWMNNNIKHAAFSDRRPIQRMIDEVEDLYTNYLAGGDRARAMAKLRVPPLGEPTSPRIVFRAGIALGLFIMLALTAVFSCELSTPPCARRRSQSIGNYRPSQRRDLPKPKPTKSIPA